MTGSSSARSMVAEVARTPGRRAPTEAPVAGRPDRRAIHTGGGHVGPTWRRSPSCRQAHGTDRSPTCVPIRLIRSTTHTPSGPRTRLQWKRETRGSGRRTLHPAAPPQGPRADSWPMSPSQRLPRSLQRPLLGPRVTPPGRPRKETPRLLRRAAGVPRESRRRRSSVVPPNPPNPTPAARTANAPRCGCRGRRSTGGRRRLVSRRGAYCPGRRRGADRCAGRVRSGGTAGRGSGGSSRRLPAPRSLLVSRLRSFQETKPYDPCPRRTARRV